MPTERPGRSAPRPDQSTHRAQRLSSTVSLLLAPPGGRLVLRGSPAPAPPPLQPPEKLAEDGNFSCRTVLIRFESRGWPHHSIRLAVSVVISQGGMRWGDPLSFGTRAFVGWRTGLLSRNVHADLLWPSPSSVLVSACHEIRPLRREIADRSDRFHQEPGPSTARPRKRPILADGCAPISGPTRSGPP
jgi:hypothetical protein